MQLHSPNPSSRNISLLRTSMEADTEPKLSSKSRSGIRVKCHILFHFTEDRYYGRQWRIWRASRKGGEAQRGMAVETAKSSAEYPQRQGSEVSLLSSVRAPADKMRSRCHTTLAASLASNQLTGNPGTCQIRLTPAGICFICADERGYAKEGDLGMPILPPRRSIPSIRVNPTGCQEERKSGSPRAWVR